MYDTIRKDVGFVKGILKRKIQPKSAEMGSFFYI